MQILEERVVLVKDELALLGVVGRRERGKRVSSKRNSSREGLEGAETNSGGTNTHELQHSLSLPLSTTNLVYFELALHGRYCQPPQSSCRASSHRSWTRSELNLRRSAHRHLPTLPSLHPCTKTHSLFHSPWRSPCHHLRPLQWSTRQGASSLLCPPSLPLASTSFRSHVLTCSLFFRSQPSDEGTHLLVPWLQVRPSPLCNHRTANERSLASSLSAPATTSPANSHLPSLQRPILYDVRIKPRVGSPSNL